MSSSLPEDTTLIFHCKPTFYSFFKELTPKISHLKISLKILNYNLNLLKLRGIIC